MILAVLWKDSFESDRKQWRDGEGRCAAKGHRPELDPDRFRGLSLQHESLHQLSYQGTLVLFFYEGLLFLFALFFFILCMRTDFNAFYEFFFHSIFITLFPSLFLLLLPGGDFFPSYFGFIYYPWFLCYVRFMSFFCQALGACNFFVWKHMELHFLYERCYRKQFIIGLFTRKCHCAFNMRHNNLDVSIPMS